MTGPDQYDLSGGGGTDWKPCDNNGPEDSEGHPYPSEMYALIRYDENNGLITTLGVSGYRPDEVAGIAASAGGACWNSVMGVG